MQHSFMTPINLASPYSNEDVDLFSDHVDDPTAVFKLMNSNLRHARCLGLTTTRLICLSSFRYHHSLPVLRSPHCLHVYPLRPNEPIRLPLGLLNYTSTQGLKLVQFSALPISESNELTQQHPPPPPPSRRAEFSGSKQDQRRHTSRDAIQLAMYRFAMGICSIPDSFPPHGGVVLDVGAGTLRDLHLPIDSVLDGAESFPIGVDIYPQEVTHAPGNRLSCDLVTATGPHIPLKDTSIDLLVSISFLQWLTAPVDQATRLVRQFAAEVGRLLRPRGGQCIMQFYPLTGMDLRMVCEELANAHPKMGGCLLLAKPVPNRGVKVFVYTRRLE